MARQLGHTESAFSMEVYAKGVKRRERLSGAYLEAFETASEWAAMGSGEQKAGHRQVEAAVERMQEPA